LQVAAYLQLVEKFVAEIRKNGQKSSSNGKALPKNVAFDVLARYRNLIAGFNDDI